jgi:hypothetical protein
MSMKTRVVWTGLLLSTVALSLLEVSRSEALPAFARREGAQCQMCHYRLPELNEDGHAYIRRGLREAPLMAMPTTHSSSQPAKPAVGAKDHGMMPSMPGMDHGKAPAKPAAKSAAAPKHTTKPATATSGMAMDAMGAPTAAATERPLGEVVPLEWQDYLTVLGHHGFEARRDERAGFDAGEVELWIAGPLDPHWSAIATIVYGIETGEVSVEQTYAQYNSAWGDKFYSVRAGQIMPFAVFFNGGGPEMPLSHPVILDEPSRSEVPRAPMTLLRGAEAGYVDLPNWNAYVGVGQPEIGASADDARTDVYASAERLFGAAGNAVSGLGYLGSIAATPASPSIEYRRLLLFANAYGARTKGVLGLLVGNDTPEGGDALATTGGFLLGEAAFTDRWAGYARYDHADRELANGDHETTSGPTLGVSHWVQTQVRLTLETQFLKATGATRDASAALQLLWAF